MFSFQILVLFFCFKNKHSITRLKNSNKIMQNMPFLTDVYPNLANSNKFICLNSKLEQVDTHFPTDIIATISPVTSHINGPPNRWCKLLYIINDGEIEYHGRKLYDMCLWKVISRDFLRNSNDDNLLNSCAVQFQQQLTSDNDLIGNTNNLVDYCKKCGVNMILMTLVGLNFDIIYIHGNTNDYDINNISFVLFSTPNEKAIGHFTLLKLVDYDPSQNPSCLSTQSNFNSNRIISSNWTDKASTKPIYNANLKQSNIKIQQTKLQQLHYPQSGQQQPIKITSNKQTKKQKKINNTQQKLEELTIEQKEETEPIYVPEEQKNSSSTRNSYNDSINELLYFQSEEIINCAERLKNQQHQINSLLQFNNNEQKMKIIQMQGEQIANLNQQIENKQKIISGLKIQNYNITSIAKKSEFEQFNDDFNAMFGTRNNDTLETMYKGFPSSEARSKN